MTLTSRAIVQTGPRTLELQEFDVPEVGLDDAVLRVEACGTCGSDWSQYKGEYSFVEYPVVMGHEPVGIVEAIGDLAAERWGLKAGDRVAVEPTLPCGTCRACRSGSLTLCAGNGGLASYGYLPVTFSDRTALWGGYADYMYLPANALVHRIDASIPAEIATLFNPLGAGIHWGVHLPGTTIGDTVVILGAGQRGLSCVLACHSAGAQRVVVTGLERDAHKLALARRLGADDAIVVEDKDPVEEILGLIGTPGADVVVDTTPAAARSIADAIEIVRPGGTVVLAGAKGTHTVDGLVSDRIILKGIRILGARGVTSRAYAAAIALMESGRHPIEQLHTHKVGLADTERGLAILGGQVPGESAIQVTIVP